MTEQYYSYKITDSSGVLKYRAVIFDSAATQSVKNAGAANAPGFAGFTQEDQSTRYAPVTVKKHGRTFAVAAGAIAIGAYVNIAGTTGKVASIETRLEATAVNPTDVIYVVGKAETSAAADGDLIELTIMDFVRQVPVS